MADENRLIDEFEFNFICEYFLNFQRQGPGSPEATVRALGFIEGLTESSKIADLGCGTGGQTMTLALNTPGSITGVDLFAGFIDRFNANAASLNLQDRVKGVVGPMDAPPFQESELDLIWSEGAIYNIGFERGLREWRKFLKPGGYVAVTEASWFTDERPAEIAKFWQDAYPEIDTIPNCVAKMQAAGYVPVAMFTLPENCWMEHYLAPQIPVQDALSAKHAGDPTVEKFISLLRLEAELYRKYAAYYGYVFYIGKRVE